MATDESEITLGAGKLLGLFFLLAATCGIFFAIGYSLGKTSAREQALNDRAAETASVTEDHAINKPSALVKTPAANTLTSDSPEASPKQSEPDLTFYKAVKQNGEDPKQEPKLKETKPAGSSETKTPDESALTQSNGSGTTGSATSATAKNSKPDPPVMGGASQQAQTAAPNGSYVVQIAAVSHEEDAAALAGALRKKSYIASVVNNPAKDKLYHVVLGPYATMQDAESMKAKLQGEGYTPIIKR